VALSDNFRKSINTFMQALVGPSVEALDEQGMTASTRLGPGGPIFPADGISQEPRGFDYPAGYNVATRPRSNSAMSFLSMKGLLDNYDIAQLAISHRVDSLRALDWSIVPMADVKGDLSQEIAYARAFFRKPDGKLFFRNWLAKYARGVLSYDAGTLYRSRNNAGQLIGLKIVDGTTIAPLIDSHGDQPTGDAPAYLQFISGMTWNWLLDSDIIYQPFRPRDDSPYGLAPIESIVIGANTDLRMQSYFLSKFTAGNVPEGFAISPDTWSAEMIDEWQQVWDAQFKGNLEIKSQLKWIPGGSKLEFPSKQDWDAGNQMAAEWWMRKTASTFHVTPDALGFAMDSNRSVGESQAHVDDRVGDIPLGQHFADIFSAVLQDDLGLPLEFQFNFGGTEESLKDTATADALYIDKGVVSASKIAELRFGITDVLEVPRFVFTNAAGPIPITSLFAASTPIDPETGGPTAGTVAVAPVAPPLPIATAAETKAIGAAPQATDTSMAKSEARPEIAAFTKFVKARRRAGSWARDFQFTDMPAGEAHRLNQSARADIRKDNDQLVAAGLAVLATDTGRVLLLQRGLDAADSAAGTWEFPGGCIETGETPEGAACREWCEETGLVLPIDARPVADWVSPNGVYGGFVYVVDCEIDLTDRLPGVNPDDPDGDAVEALAWWEPKMLAGNPAIRAELTADLSIVLAAIADGASYPPVSNPVEDDASPLVKGWRDSSAGQPQNDYDLQLVDYYSPLIAAVLQKWIEGIPFESVTSGLIVKATGTDIEAIRASVKKSLGRMPLPAELNQILANLYADGWTAGEHAAATQLTPHIVSVEGLSEATVAIDWDNWVPGDPGAGLAISSGGMRAMMDERGVTIKGFTDSALDQIGNMIGDGLGAGDSVDGIRSRVLDVSEGMSASRADRIAHTESTRAVTAASFDVYHSNGVGQWNLVTADAGVDQLCADTAAQNPHDMEDQTGAPPLHPYCRCAASPVPESIDPANISTIDSAQFEGEQ